MALSEERYDGQMADVFKVQDEIRQRTIAILQEGAAKKGPHVVVSHSMGTVIAYDCLKRVAAARLGLGNCRRVTTPIRCPAASSTG